ncbi:hypothetical protein AVEN_250165-1 [Araneus ventricosus]|uniref:Uncharacterized protein n=1 Tax=Araneus ventricosus TaxID=182803 RepID=A0A4Y2MMV0_ARAVE|nr:hypothetical protein AVEN_250165-1 [Araneus ventricosus]
MDANPGKDSICMEVGIDEGTRRTFDPSSFSGIRSFSGFPAGSLLKEATFPVGRLADFNFEMVPEPLGGIGFPGQVGWLRISAKSPGLCINRMICGSKEGL